MIRRWVGFTGALCGGLYVFIIVGVTAHEILGHGMAALLAGGNFHSFSILPGGAGWAWTSEAGELRWVVTWAGIAVNLALGLCGLAVLILRRRPLSSAGLALFLFTVTQLGSGLQYPLLGFITKRGDARRAAETASWPIRALVISTLLGLFVFFLIWSLRRLLVFLEENYAPSGTAGRRLAFLASVVLPIGLLVALLPAGEVFTIAQRRWFYVTLFATLAGVGLVVTLKAPRGADPERARPPGVVAGVLWICVAAGVYLATVKWLGQVDVSL